MSYVLHGAVNAGSRLVASSNLQAFHAAFTIMYPTILARAGAGSGNLSVGGQPLHERGFVALGFPIGSAQVLAAQAVDHLRDLAVTDVFSRGRLHLHGIRPGFHLAGPNG